MKSQENEITKVYKRKGITMGKLLKEVETKYNLNPHKEKIAFAGRLDPLAHGEVLLLIGKNACKRLEEFTKKDKKYIFKMISNLKTDSLDILGLAKLSDNMGFLTNDFLKDKIKFLNGKSYQQIYPNYSSICVKNSEGIRQPMWWWTKNNRLNEINIPSKLVSIKNIELIESENINSKILIDEIIGDINLLEDEDNGFRKKEILENWKRIKKDNNLPEYFQVFELEADVSSGTYIRQLVKDIGSIVGVDLLTLSIYRPNKGIL